MFCPDAVQGMAVATHNHIASLPNRTIYTEGVSLGRTLRTSIFPFSLALILLYFLYFFHLGGVGLLGPDEPRYASIGRHMAESGDWVSPVLWGQPWFEKPPLAYWLTASGTLSGLPGDLAARIPTALLSAVFLIFFFLLLRAQLTALLAAAAAGILATSAGWIAFSHVATTDLPLAATFSAAMLLSLRWISSGSSRARNAAGVCFGLAVLAKGLVPIILALPMLWFARRLWRQAWIPITIALAVSLPWYAAVTFRFGRAFLDEFFWKHHFQRFASDVLQHQQPLWFYVPVLLGGLFPWFLFCLLAFRRDVRDAWTGTLAGQFALAWFATGFVFFSLSANKLPGYLLPLLPAAAILFALAWERARNVSWLLGASTLLLCLVPAVATVLPQALQSGLSSARWGDLPWEYAAAIAPAAILTAWLERLGFRRQALLFSFLLITAAVSWLKLSVFPVLENVVSARAFWHRIESRSASTCIDTIHRTWRYGLNFYSREPLPDCDITPRPWRIRQSGDDPPTLESAPPAASSSTPATRPL